LTRGRSQDFDSSKGEGQDFVSGEEWRLNLKIFTTWSKKSDDLFFCLLKYLGSSIPSAAVFNGSGEERWVGLLHYQFLHATK